MKVFSLKSLMLVSRRENRFICVERSSRYICSRQFLCLSGTLRRTTSSGTDTLLNANS